MCGCPARFWASDEDVIRQTLELFIELTTFGNGKMLLTLEAVNYILTHHTVRDRTQSAVIEPLHVPDVLSVAHALLPSPSCLARVLLSCAPRLAWYPLSPCGPRSVPLPLPSLTLPLSIPLSFSVALYQSLLLSHFVSSLSLYPLRLLVRRLSTLRS